MRISVVTISYNQSKFLRQCIDSVLSQDFEDIEYIVVDPGSTDGSREIIDSYGDRIIRVYEKDAGPADGLNKGFSVATGDVYCFINSDDFLLPCSLNSVSRIFKKRKDVDVIFGAGRFVNGEGELIGKATPSKFTPWLYAYGAVTLFQQGAFFRSFLFDEIGGFNPQNKICWDGELFVDLSMNGAKTICIKDELAAFRMDGSNISSSPVYFEKLKSEKNRLFKKIMGREVKSIDRFLRCAAKIVKLSNFSYMYRRFVSLNFSRPPHLRFSQRKLND